MGEDGKIRRRKSTGGGSKSNKLSKGGTAESEESRVLESWTVVEYETTDSNNGLG